MWSTMQRKQRLLDSQYWYSIWLVTLSFCYFVILLLCCCVSVLVCSVYCSRRFYFVAKLHRVSLWILVLWSWDFFICLLYIDTRWLNLFSDDSILNKFLQHCKQTKKIIKTIKLQEMQSKKIKCKKKSTHRQTTAFFVDHFRKDECFFLHFIFFDCIQPPCINI